MKVDLTRQQVPNELQKWVANLDRRTYALLIGLSIGVIGGTFGLMIALLGPTVTLAACLGLFFGLYILTDIRIALYGIIFVLVLLPFGASPVKIGITPTILDVALAAFLLVYATQWMTRKRQHFRLAPPYLFILVYMMWLAMTFTLGLRYAPPTATIIRQFAETFLSIGLVFIIGDVLRDPKMLRRLVLVITIAVSIEALAALVLYVLPDATTESLLVRLSRFGYPDGGVIRYIEDDPANAERAIGTWVDPNALGGTLAVAAAMIVPQLFARKPVLRYRWLTVVILAVIGFALLLTFSRASFLALGFGLLVIGIIRYRRMIPILVIAGVIFLFLPQTQEYIARLGDAFTGADLATQMRLGEWQDSINLIQQYPVFGVGFTGTPSANLYTDVANMYLIMANQIGLLGVAIFALAMASVFIYGIKAWQFAKNDDELDSIHLGYHIALLVALVNSVADLYFFRLDFQSSITWFWIVVALAVASSRLIMEKYAVTDSRKKYNPPLSKKHSAGSIPPA